MDADQDIYCPACGYNLRGLSQPRCPECGQTFDPRTLEASRIPWVHRRSIGRTRAFWRTVVMATFRNQQFTQELVRPASYPDARAFRWTVILWVTMSLALAAAVMLVCYLWNWGPAHFGWAVSWAALLGLALIAAVTVTAVVPTWFSYSRWLDTEHSTRATVLSYYTAGPLVWLTVPLLMVAVLAVWDTLDPLAASWETERVIVVATAACMVLSIWFGLALATVNALAQRSIAVTIAIDAAMLVVWPITVILCVGGPAAAVAYWMLMGVSMHP